MLQRDLFQCQSCHQYTLKCRMPHCKNMTRGEEHLGDKKSGIIDIIKSEWSNELCAEHDGSIVSFKDLSLQINDLCDYTQILKKKRDKVNVSKTLKYTVVSLGATAAIYITVGAAAPGIAALLGSTGILGASSTGTVISSLSGAALTNASLAAIGGGALSAGGFGMSGGILFISATGGALGTAKGAVISNGYFGEVRDFSIKKVRDGDGPAIIFINGFLSQKNQDCSDWLEGVEERYPDNPCYYVTWESKANYDLGSLALKGWAFKSLINKLKEKSAKKCASKLSPYYWAAAMADIIGNPWHTTMVKSSMTGLILADLIPRVNEKNGFILMGHSLGCRVIYYLLTALSTKKEQYIKEVHLFGGAVAKSTAEEWEQAAKAVDGNIYNYYTSNDWVLGYLYRSANVWQSDPIGINEIEYKSDNIQNIDVSETVSGHMDYKNKLVHLLK